MSASTQLYQLILLNWLIWVGVRNSWWPTWKCSSAATPNHSGESTNWGQCYKTFLFVTYDEVKETFITGKPFQPGLIFAVACRHGRDWKSRWSQISKSWYQKSFEKFRYWEISYWFGQNFSIQDEKVWDQRTNMIWDIFEMSSFDIVRAKKSHLGII